MSYIEIEDCKRGYILKGENNHKVHKDKYGKIIRGHYMIFLESRTSTDFIGVMITTVDYNGRNIVMNDNHFLSHFSEEPHGSCRITNQNSHLVQSKLLKIDDMGPFIKVGELSDSGIEFVEEQVKNIGPYEWEEYLYLVEIGEL